MTSRAALRAVILGCAGTVLDADEFRFMADADPAGFILFKRNCESPDQVRALVAALREAVTRPDAPVLVDQEGGRVTRLGPPHWREPPAPALLGALTGIDEAAAVRAAWLSARLVAADLHPLGIAVNCAPTLDLRLVEASQVIGDRALGADPHAVTRLGRAVVDGSPRRRCRTGDQAHAGGMAGRLPTATRSCRASTRRSNRSAPATSCPSGRCGTRRRA